MLRQSITKGSGLAASTSRRALSTTARAMAGGDTGAPSKYGSASKYVPPGTVKKTSLPKFRVYERS